MHGILPKKRNLKFQNESDYGIQIGSVLSPSSIISGSGFNTQNNPKI
jgi:hypothetical protein